MQNNCSTVGQTMAGWVHCPLSLLDSQFSSRMKIAIIADWLPTYGGAEHVLAALHDAFPMSPIFTTVARPKKLSRLGKANIHTDRLLQGLFRMFGTHTILLPLLPAGIERIDCRGFDVIISSSHAIGKGVIAPSTARHICYCHTPMRYAWEMEESYLQDFRIPKFLKATVRRCLTQLRRWDMTTAKRTDRFIANSTATQERIARIYGRESTVLHPPIEQQFFTTPLSISAPQDRSAFLAIGRLVPYKRFDLLIETCNRHRLPLVVAGSGSDERRLRAMAGPTVQMMGYVPEGKLPALYAHAKALLFPQIEDAGVTALEAQATGTPVIALGKGGALDTVLPGSTGILFPEQTADALTDAIEAWQQTSWDARSIRMHAKPYAIENFIAAIRRIVDEECSIRS